MASKVNLDSLIRREDFRVKDDFTPSQSVYTIAIRDLETDAFFYSTLRKPDFQRETADWDSDKVAEFIHSFLKGDLIPAIILWQSGSTIFIIDGAHRLSALIAWVQDDYGDGPTSMKFFKQTISDDQQRVATTTRNKVKKLLGTYSEHKAAAPNPESYSPNIVERSKRLASLALQLQWVKGDAEQAEESFFKINQQAAPINKTELRLIKYRNKPSAIAARAIIRGGTGHKYWNKFDEQKSEEIVSIATEIHNDLFSPPLSTPITTLDIPVGGRLYSAQTLSLVLDLVNLSNSLNSEQEENNLEDDFDGTDTLKFLRETRKVVRRITGKHPSSLGLHPAVYFYGNNGRYQQTAFLAIVDFILELEKRNKFKAFTSVRGMFESLLLQNKNVVNQVTLKQGSGRKGYRLLKDFFWFVFTQLEKGKDKSEVLDLATQNKKFAFLNIDKPVYENTEGQSFSEQTKSTRYLIEALQNPITCKICGGLIHSASISFDHKTRKQDGGDGSLENSQLSHLYCNTGYKN